MSFRAFSLLTTCVLIVACSEVEQPLSPDGDIVLNVVDDAGRVEGRYQTGGFAPDDVKTMVGTLCAGGTPAGYVEDKAAANTTLVAICDKGTVIGKNAKVAIRKTDPGQAVAFRTYAVGERLIQDQVPLSY